MTEPLPRGVISKQTSFGCRVRWYLRYALSYRDLEEMIWERGLSVIIPPSLAGSSTMLQNWKSAVGLTSRPPTTPGVSMRRPSRSKSVV
jgi:hypothetical protein